MPTYQYACTTSDCGNEFELVQSFTDPAASECPVCHGPVRKKFSAVGVVFKGSGFYRTDSRSSSTASDAPKSKDTSSSSSSTDSGSSSSSSSTASSSSASTPAGTSGGSAGSKAAAPSA